MYVLFCTLLGELRLFSLAKLVKTLLEGRIERWVRDKRTLDISLGVVVGQGDKNSLRKTVLNIRKA